MSKNEPQSSTDLLALAMRKVRAEVADGRVPKHPPDAEDDAPQLDEESPKPQPD